MCYKYAWTSIVLSNIANDITFVRLFIAAQAHHLPLGVWDFSFNCKQSFLSSFVYVSVCQPSASACLCFAAAAPSSCFGQWRLPLMQHDWPDPPTTLQDVLVTLTWAAFSEPSIHPSCWFYYFLYKSLLWFPGRPKFAVPFVKTQLLLAHHSTQFKRHQHTTEYFRNSPISYIQNEQYPCQSQNCKKGNT